MKYVLVTIFAIFASSCQESVSKYTGPPIITKKTVSLDGETCTYTYIGYGQEGWFEDPCDKYSVGDTLKGK